jgi:CRP-like cAMP-binding protein
MFARDGDNFRRVASPLLGLGFDPDVPTPELTRRALALLPHTPPVRSLERVGGYDWSQEIEDGLIEQALRVFDGLDDDQLSEIVAHSHIIDLAAGDYVIRKGQFTRTMYILLGGVLHYQDGPKHIGNSQVGEAVGDVAFLLRRPRVLDVIAGPAGARVLSLNEPALRTVMESHSQTAAIVLLNLCRMLAERVAAGR